jgi:hypothetical protein
MASFTPFSVILLQGTQSRDKNVEPVSSQARGAIEPPRPLRCPPQSKSARGPEEYSGLDRATL